MSEGHPTYKATAIGKVVCSHAHECDLVRSGDCGPGTGKLTVEGSATLYGPNVAKDEARNDLVTELRSLEAIQQAKHPRSLKSPRNLECNLQAKNVVIQVENITVFRRR